MASEESVPEQFPRKVLVLYVDRDDDLGFKAGVQTPVVGREDNLKAAILFALKDPEDSDVNALFAAIQIYDELKRSNIDCELATITGSRRGGLEADLKVREQLERVLKVFNADGVILVSDGVVDEQVLPIIQSRVPVISVRRIVVQQSRGIEETYVMLIRYMHKVIEDPRLRKLFLGIPGVFLMVLSVLAVCNLIQYAGLALGIILSFVFIVKGFSLDERFSEFYERMSRWWSEAPILFFSSVVSIITFLAGLYIGSSSVVELIMKEKRLSSYALGHFLLAPQPTSPIHAIDIILTAIILFLIGRVLDSWLSERGVQWRDLVGIVFFAMSRQTLIELALIIMNKGSLMLLIYWTSATIAICASMIVLFAIRERVHKKGEKSQRIRTSS
ncbi:MAG: hypothetical protein DRN15_10515 [Thermoprotei archaeon]|nr:MAG: hypothetical protein DRM97_06730 [Thermoprotei archaeon]RLF21825.1 MAG: hypothetical protein DRN15_10515 [Thermoprotei archaeon]